MICQTHADSPNHMSGSGGVQTRQVGNPFERLSQAFSAFAVDTSASKADTATDANTRTVVAGPIELHRREDGPLLKLPSWKDAIAGRKPTAGLENVANGGASQVPHGATNRNQHSSTSGNLDSHVQADRRTVGRIPSTNSIHGHSERHVHRTVAHRDDRHPETTLRASGHVVPGGVEYALGGGDVDSSYMMATPSPSHQVIRSPGQSVPIETQQSQLHSGLQAKTQAMHERHRQTHPDHSSIRRRIQPEPPTIPGGRQRETWKQPYSYGYFGASGERHWSMQHGYRDRFTQWSRR